MSGSNNSERLGDLAERAKCLAVSSVMPKTRTSYDSCWNQFVVFCSDNNLHDPSDVTDEAPNNIALFITTRFDECTNAAGTCDNIRSGIRSHYKRVIKAPDGWNKCNVINKFVGNPCDAIEITELIKGTCNTSRSRGDTSKRSAPMTMRMLCSLWDFIKTFIIANPNCDDEGIYVMAGCAACFYLWLRIDEIFKLRFKKN